MEEVFYLKIDGVDMTKYIAYSGYKWQRSDVDGPGAGRDLTGVLRRNRLATKERLDITCRPLKTSESAIVLQAILPEWVEVEYLSPMAGGTVKKTMYSNNNPAAFQQVGRDGEVLWTGITFPLIEK